jgi:uncharacterized protein (DUF2237 family)
VLGYIYAMPQVITALNVLGGPLEACSFDPLTGFMRTGCCETGPDDLGSHTVCARVTQVFLEFSRARGNDLMTPRPQWRFAGLKPGDRWCLCASRWLEACEAGVAPPVILQATHHHALRIVPLDLLRRHAWGSVDATGPDVSDDADSGSPDSR